MIPAIKIRTGNHRVLNVFPHPSSPTSDWDRYVGIEQNHFIVISGSSQILPIFLYLCTTLWLTYHSDICRGFLTPVQRRYYPPTQQDFKEAEWDLNYRFNEQKARSSFLADFPAVGWFLIISNTPTVYFPSAAVTITTFVGQFSAGHPIPLWHTGSQKRKMSHSGSLYFC